MTDRLPKRWERRPLGELVCPRETRNPRKNGPGQFRYIDIDALDNAAQTIRAPKTLDNAEAPSRARMVIRSGDVLFSLVRPYLKNIAIVPPDLDNQLASTAYCVLRPKDSIDSRFLFYQLLQDRFINSVPTYGNSPPSARDEEFLAMPVVWAPLEDQRRIVARIEELFSKLDAGVEALRRARANLKRYRASVLKAAVEGRLTADWHRRHPDVEPASELLQRILAERRRRWEEVQRQKLAQKRGGATPHSPLRIPPYKEPAGPSPDFLAQASPLPKSWCWATVEQMGLVQLGRQRSPKYHTGPHMRPYLRVMNVFEDRIDTSDVMEMNFSPQEYAIYRLQSGDILLNEGQSMELVGRPAMYRDEVPGSCFTNTLIRFTADQGVLAEYALTVFLAYLRSGRFKEAATITVNIAHLGASRFAAIEFPLPPLDEQGRIVEEADNQLRSIAQVSQILSVLDSKSVRVRQTVLQSVFRGESCLTNHE